MAEQQAAEQFAIQRIYVKDISMSHLMRRQYSVKSGSQLFN